MFLFDGLNQTSIKDEFEELQQDPCMKPIKVNDRVLVATKFIRGSGNSWDRGEAVVTEVCNMGLKIRDPDNKYPAIWIHPAIILDVIESE